MYRCTFEYEVSHPHDRLILLILARYRGDHLIGRRDLMEDAILTEAQLKRSYERLKKRGYIEGPGWNSFQLTGCSEPFTEPDKPKPTKKYGWWDKVRLRIFERDNGQCTYCGTELTLESFNVDHLLPRSRGGTDEESNLALSCVFCNSKKGSKTPEEWARSTGRSETSIGGNA